MTFLANVVKLIGDIVMLPISFIRSLSTVVKLAFIAIIVIGAILVWQLCFN